ncbi:SagB family peptide dehydrogenase [Streptomyces montanisoli]|uniref:SagB family peptide dehydrogenase n=1 Tax=Streptomyces montanisoli TaxID=2798581 RepID=A0A940MCM4_9ACTN|nr:SagB family peptide dehydrogenase [Streptomyces montanisoli]MBP0456586.1 SagB family peptide dehydrogenase [Streptomyces montanisoli]
MSRPDELESMLDGLSARDREAVAAMLRPALRARERDGDRAALDVVGLAHRALNNPETMAAKAEVQGAQTPRVLPERAGRAAVPFPGELPKLTHPLQDVLAARASRRDFAGRGLGLDEIAGLLTRAYGIRGTMAAYNSPDFPARYAPSAGGVQSTDVYVVVNDVDGVAPGAYLYAPQDDGLRLVNRGDMRRLLVDACPGTEWMYSAGAVLVLAGALERGRWKYGDRAYCFAHFDAGFVGENLCLCATSLGLRICAVAGFDADRLAGVLGLDGKQDIPLLLMPVGSRA